jgi:hypothetical protein
MQYDIEFDTDSKIAVVRPIGVPDFKSTIHAMLELRSHESFGPEYSILCDFRAMKYTPTTNEATDMGRIGSSPTVFGGRRVAIVSKETSLLTVGTIIKAVAAAWGADVKLFKELHEAKEWLTSK